jgi:hypothetical protein
MYVKKPTAAEVSPAPKPSPHHRSWIVSGTVVCRREDLDALRRSCIVSGEI